MLVAVKDTSVMLVVICCSCIVGKPSVCCASVRMGFLPRRALKTEDERANPLLILCLPRLCTF